MSRYKNLHINDLITILQEYKERYCNMKVSITINHGREIPMREHCFSFVPDLPTGHLNYDLILEEDPVSILESKGGNYGR
jgi:hypothetical protein